MCLCLLNHTIKNQICQAPCHYRYHCRCVISIMTLLNVFDIHTARIYSESNRAMPSYTAYTQKRHACKQAKGLTKNYCRSILSFHSRTSCLKDLAGNAFNGRVIFATLIMMGLVAPMTSDTYKKWQEMISRHSHRSFVQSMVERVFFHLF